MYDFDRVIDRYGTNSAKWDDQVDALPLWIADMDFQAPPAVLEALHKKVDHGIFGYTSFPQTYYAAVIDWVKRRHGWAMEQEWITFTPGVIPALITAVTVFSNPGDKVIVQPPVFAPFFSSIEGPGRHVLANNLVLENGRYRMDLEDLRQKAQDPRAKMLILCSPHNPVGRVWSREDLQAVGEICLENDILVIADELHCDLLYEGFTHTPFGSIDDRFLANSIICLSPSKTFNLAGLQTSCIVIPDERKRAQFNASNLLGRSSPFGVEALTAAYNHGEQWLEDFLVYLHGNLKFLSDYLAEHIPSIKLMAPEGTYVAWLDCRQISTDPQELQDFFLNKARVWIDSGATYGTGGAGFQRMNLACPRSTLKEALDRIKGALNQA